MTDDKILDKIRALLNKAESTNFGPEAEAFVGKAHELMMKYAIDEALLHQSDGKQEEIVIKKVKATKGTQTQPGRAGLLNAVCRTSRCRAIISGDFLTIVGFKSDVEYVEMMYTSLVVQMLGGLYDARDKDHVTGKGVGYDMSFCHSYQARIFERLDEITTKIEHDAGGEAGIVLYDRKKKVNDHVRMEFPNLRAKTLTTRVNDGRGRDAGYNAANNADLGQSRIGSKKALGR